MVSQKPRCNKEMAQENMDGLGMILPYPCFLCGRGPCRKGLDLSREQYQVIAISTEHHTWHDFDEPRVITLDTPFDDKEEARSYVRKLRSNEAYFTAEGFEKWTFLIRVLPEPKAEIVAHAIHEAYERLAQKIGYETHEGTRVPWPELPKKKKELMIAVAAELLERGVIEKGPNA